MMHRTIFRRLICCGIIYPYSFKILGKCKRNTAIQPAEKRYSRSNRFRISSSKNGMIVSLSGWDWGKRLKIIERCIL